MDKVTKGGLTPGKLAAATGCTVETVRYYEKLGLLPAVPRSVGGHRYYAETHVKRLYFIRRSRELGFPLEQVRQLLRCADEPAQHRCGEVKTLALAQVAEVESKLADLTRLRQALLAMTSCCNAEGDTTAHCPIIESLFSGERLSPPVSDG